MKKSSEKIEKTLTTFVISLLLIGKKFANFILPKSKQTVVNTALFIESWRKSLDLYQLKFEKLLNSDPKNKLKTNILKTQIFNIQKITDSVFSSELLLNINNKTMYANCILLYKPNFNFTKYYDIKNNKLHKTAVLNDIYKPFTKNLLEKTASIKLMNNDNINNNLNRLNTLFSKMYLKNKNCVLLNTRPILENRKTAKLYESYLNSIMQFIALDIDTKTRNVKQKNVEIKNI